MYLSGGEVDEKWKVEDKNISISITTSCKNIILEAAGYFRLTYNNRSSYDVLEDAEGGGEKRKVNFHKASCFHIKGYVQSFPLLKANTSY